MNTEPDDVGKPATAAGADAPHPDPAPELTEEHVTEDHKAWCEAYVHVWADLSRGNYDKAAVEKAADEHWQRSPKSDPVEIATTEFIKPVGT